MKHRVQTFFFILPSTILKSCNVRWIFFLKGELRRKDFKVHDFLKTFRYVLDEISFEKKMKMKKEKDTTLVDEENFSAIHVLENVWNVCQQKRRKTEKAEKRIRML